MPSSSPNPSGSITPDPLTPELEAEIGARRAAVTDAPWGSTRDLDGQYTVQAGARVTLTEGFASSGDVARIIGEDDELRYRRADFIARSPRDIDALFAEIDRLRRAYIFDTAELKLEIDRLREDNKRLRQSRANGEKVTAARDAQLSTFRHLAAEHLYRSTEAAADPDDLKARSSFLNEATIAGRFHDQLERAGIDLTAELDRVSTEGGAQ